MNMERAIVPAACAALLIAAGSSLGQVIDGSRDGNYGAALTTQGARVIDILIAGPVSGAGQTNNSNTAGLGAYLGGDFDGPPEDVLTGIEFVIPVSELDWDGSSAIDIVAFINGQSHDFMSNQIIGGLANEEFPAPGNPGEPRNVDFQDTLQFPGNQFRSIAVGTPSGAEVIDGTASANYPGPSWIQDVPTGFGNNTNPDQFAAGGSEFNALRAYRDDNGTPGVPGDDLVYVHISGNLQTNFNKIDIFFDVKAGGQNRLRNDNADVDFNGLNRMGSTAPTNGLLFDVDFEADYYLTLTNGIGGSGQPEVFGSAAVIFTEGDPNTGTPEQAGNFVAGGVSASGPYTGAGPNGGDITFLIDNSNVLGVSSPGGGTGGDVPNQVPGPEAVQTGVEFAINLEEAGYDDNGQIGIAGFLMFSGWDFFSNQVIGGLPADTNSLGSPASDKSFNDSDPEGIPGNQFVTLSVPANPSTVLPALNGQREASYGAALWVNSNSTSFGNNTDAGPDDATGSEICAVYAQVVEDAEGDRVLYVFIAGNIGQFHRLVTFYDLKAGGQNPLRGDNPDIDFNGLNNMEGFAFDAGFVPDFCVGYHLGFNETTLQVEHYLDAAEVLTDGSESQTPLGGRLDGGAKTATPLSGEVALTQGFGDNSLGGGAQKFDANGSELASVYARIGTVNNPFVGPVPSLFLMLTGNLEPNGNKLEIFFDTIPGNGQNTLIYDDPENPNGYQGNPIIEFPEGGQSAALNRMGGDFPIFLLDENGDPVLDEFGDPIIVDTLPGLTFDDGFNADHWLSVELFGHNPSVPSVTVQALFARLRGAQSPGDAGDGRFVGSAEIFTGADGSFLNGTLGGFESIRAFVDNSNIAGVPGGEDPAIAFADINGPAASVTTGIEVAIPLEDLNWDGQSDIKIQAFINGINHDFVSNQHLQFVCSFDLGEPRLVNFNDFGGVQFLELDRLPASSNFQNLSARPDDCEAAIECPGDLDGNNEVNSDDLGILLGAFGGGPAGDLDGDGDTDSDDLGILLSAFGDVCG